MDKSTGSCANPGRRLLQTAAARARRSCPYLYDFDNGKLSALAGLWESWTDLAVASAGPLQTFTLITTDANELALEIHDRIPVIVHPEYRARAEFAALADNESNCGNHPGSAGCQPAGFPQPVPSH